MFFVSSKVYSRERCHFSLVFQKFYKGTPGTSRTGLQPIAIPLSSISAAYRFNNITANTSRLFEHCYNVFRSESSVLSRSMSFFSSLSKIIQGDTRVRTRDLADCSRMLYPELYRRCIQIQKYHCKHAQVVWALLQGFLFPVKCTLAIDVIFL